MPKNLNLIKISNVNLTGKYPITHNSLMESDEWKLLLHNLEQTVDESKILPCVFKVRLIKQA